MNGKLIKKDDQWFVKYIEEISRERLFRTVELPLYPKDAKSLNESENDPPFDGLVIQFEIIDEFTHQELYEGLDWGIGKFAKLK